MHLGLSLRPALRLLLAIAVGLCALLQSAEGIALDAGDRAPTFRVDDLSGGEISLRTFRGKVVIVDFWASWCEPCKEELPFLNRLYRDKREDGLVVIGVSVDRRLRNVRAFLRDVSVAFPVIHDDEQEIADRYSPPSMPTSFIIDRQGVVRYVHRGFREGDASTIRSQVNRLLRERPRAR